MIKYLAKVRVESWFTLFRQSNLQHVCTTAKLKLVHAIDTITLIGMTYRVAPLRSRGFIVKLNRETARLCVRVHVCTCMDKCILVVFSNRKSKGFPLSMQWACNPPAPLSGNGYNVIVLSVNKPNKNRCNLYIIITVSS